MPQARQWWDERRNDWVDFELPVLEVDWCEAEPLILYGPDGDTVLSEWTPPVGFARAIEEGA